MLLIGEIFLPGVLYAPYFLQAYADRTPYIHCTSRLAHSSNAKAGSSSSVPMSCRLMDEPVGGMALDEVQAQLLAIPLLVDAQGSQQTDTAHDTAGDQEG